MATKKKKEDYVKDAMNLGLGIGGGVAANFGTTWLEKQAFMGKMAPYSSALVSLVGAIGYVMLPDPKMKAFAFGMSVIGGTESVETLITQMTPAPTTTTTAVAGLGFTQQQLGLGFTGKPLPEGDMPFYSKGGVAVR